MTEMHPARSFRSILAAALLLLTAMPAHAGEAVDGAAERARAAGVDPAVVRTLVERTERAALAEADRAALLDRVADAAGRGLPSGAVAEKALEGLAKRVPAARLQAALDGLVDRLARAAEAIPARPGTTPRERADVVRAGADALRAGATGPTISAVAKASGGNARGAIALYTLSGLIEAGVPVEQAKAVVEGALARNMTDARIASLDRATVTIANLTELAPAQAAKAAVDGFARGLDAVEIADEYRGIRDGMTGRGGVGGTTVGGTPADGVVSGAVPGDVPGGRTLEVPEDGRDFGTSPVPTNPAPTPTSAPTGAPPTP